MKTKKRVIKAYVWPTLLYGCETWTITTKNMTKLQSFEMWAYRKIMKISWREKKRRSPKIDRRTALHNPHNKEKKNYQLLTHHIRRNNIHRLILEGPLEGKGAEESQ